jgi:hypothetical protein
MSAPGPAAYADDLHEWKFQTMQASAGLPG